MKGIGKETPKSAALAGEPRIAVGIMDGEKEVKVFLNGPFTAGSPKPLSGPFSAEAISGEVLLRDNSGKEAARARGALKLTGTGDSTFILKDVTIGKAFHWERKEEQTFQGSLTIKARENGTLAAINEIALEDYLKSVVSSEMRASAPEEFLKAHAILSRSWFLSAMARKKTVQQASPHASSLSEGEIVRWYEQEEHELFDVCADDHCQRYQGITKIVSVGAGRAVSATRGMAIVYGGEICDARYSKACGGLTEEFATAWADKSVPYLVSIADAPVPYQRVTTEEQAEKWILGAPEAYCNTNDRDILSHILPDFDQETMSFFRWIVEYGREELEEILREKSGIDFGTLKEITPIRRGPSGRIMKLAISGTRKTVTVGKELEIRRWLSKSHLLSSAFTVTTRKDSSGNVEGFTFQGAGWGHGVGLCQIGAAVMAHKGFSAEEIIRHYFPGADIEKVY